METYRIGVIGLGQRIAHVLAAMKEVGWNLQVVADADPAPVGRLDPGGGGNRRRTEPARCKGPAGGGPL